MAPVKFGLFKGRSREQPEPPSTENLLQNSCTDLVVYPSSPIPSTSSGLYQDHNGFQEFSLLHLDSDDEDDSERLPVARRSSVCKNEEAQANYRALPSSDMTSSTILQESLQDLKDFHDFQDELNEMHKFEYVSPDDATSIDANSIQFDETSIFSDDVKYCGAATKKQKRNKAKEEQMIQEQQNDSEMWRATNYEVLQHLLSRSGTLDEQIKWEAIATARGLCTLTATCTCGDCSPGKSANAMNDGDGGLGAAPLFGAVAMGCELQ